MMTLPLLSLIINFNLKLLISLTRRVSQPVWIKRNDDDFLPENIVYWGLSCYTYKFFFGYNFFHLKAYPKACLEPVIVYVYSGVYKLSVGRASGIIEVWAGDTGING